MRLLDKYMFRELLAPLGFCLGGFLIFWLSFDLLTSLDDLQAHKLRGIDVLEYYAVRTPEFIVTVLPMALLLAVLYALGRHAKHNELTAMRVAGLSMWRVCLPHIMVGCTASLAFFALNELCVPNTQLRAEQVLNKRICTTNRDSVFLVRNYGFTNARQKRTWQFGTYDLQTAEMTDVKIDWEQPDGNYVELIAKRAFWTAGTWRFYDVWQNVYSADPAKSPTPIGRNHFDELPMPAFSETPQQIRSEINISTKLSKRIGKRADIPLLELYNYIQLHPELSKQDHAWFYTRFHGRLAAPLTCLVAVLIAIPFGAGLGWRNVYVGVASSISLCFGYFVLMQLGLALGSGGYVPPLLGAWLPNLLFALSSVWLITQLP